MGVGVLIISAIFSSSSTSIVWCLLDLLYFPLFFKIPFNFFGTASGF
jgi:hypothetical protein